MSEHSVNCLYHENLTTYEFSCVDNTRGGDRAKLKSS